VNGIVGWANPSADQLPKDFFENVDRMIAFLNAAQEGDFTYTAEVAGLPFAVDLIARLGMQPFLDYLEANCVR
jgi:hypothetical protein